jgi:uncharacterized protein
MTSSNSTQEKMLPIRDGIFILPLEPLEKAQLAGTRCLNCGEVSLGTVPFCPNCTGNKVEVIPLSRNGILWTYTVIRTRPPGDYKGPDPFVPFGEGLVELPEGIRVLSPLKVDIDQIKIGMELELVAYPLYVKEGKPVIAFAFKPV